MFHRTVKGSGDASFIVGGEQHRGGFTMEISNNGHEKAVIQIGGFGTTWGGEQFHQQNRVYSRKGISISINARGNNGCVVKCVSELSKQRDRDI